MDIKYRKDRNERGGVVILLNKQYIKSAAPNDDVWKVTETVVCELCINPKIY